MTKKFLLIPMAVVFGFSGCAGLSYDQPTTGDRARVRFVTDTTGVTVLRTYEGDDCAGTEKEWMRLKRGVMYTSSVTRLGMPLWDYEEKAAKEVYVASAKPLNAIFWGTLYEGRWHYQCGVPITANFDAGKDYEIKYSWHPSMCRAVLYEIVQKGDQHELLKIKEFSNRSTTLRSGCLAQFKRFRLD